MLQLGSKHLRRLHVRRSLDSGVFAIERAGSKLCFPQSPQESFLPLTRVRELRKILKTRVGHEFAPSEN